MRVNLAAVLPKSISKLAIREMIINTLDITNINSTFIASGLENSFDLGKLKISVDTNEQTNFSELSKFCLIEQMSEFEKFVVNLGEGLHLAKTNIEDAQMLADFSKKFKNKFEYKS